MGLYRKKPVVIEAEQFREGQTLSSAFADAPISYTQDGKLIVRTSEGMMIAEPGDWIIRGVEGEFYPCKQSVFEKTYEPADEPRAWYWA